MYIIEPDSVFEDAYEDVYIGNCDNPVWQTNTVNYAVGSYNTYYVYKEMTDREIPNFHARKASGEVFMNPMTSTVTDVLQTPFPFGATIKTFRWGCTPARWYESNRLERGGSRSTLRVAAAVGFSTDPAITINSDSLKEQAITKAWSNLDQSKIMALVSIAEAEKSLGTIKNVSLRALRIIKGARKNALKMIAKTLKSKKSRRRLARDLSDLYLEARYGLRPMYYDINGVVEAVNNFDCSRHDRLTVRGYRNATDQNSGTDQFGPNNWNNTQYAYYQNWKDTISVEARAGCLAAVQLSAVNDWGIGLLGESAWELVPFSFIVDWFLNVGDTISSWMPKPNTNVLGSWVTVKTVTRREATVVCEIYNNLTSTLRVEVSPVSASGRYSKQITTVQRIPDPSRPIVPSWLIRLDPAKLLDLVLIANNFRKEKREFSTISRHFKTLRF
jgi:hypothetical protein